MAGKELNVRPRKEFPNKSLDSSLLHLSALGLVLSLVLNLLSLFHLPRLLPGMGWGLVVGAFAVGALIVFGRVCAIGITRKDDMQKDKDGLWTESIWVVFLRGCPQWMEYLIISLFSYAALTFILFAFVEHISAPSPTIGGAETYLTSWQVQMVCAFLMVFYCISMAVLYSSSRQE
jgi:hypothetical protein